MLQQVDYTSQRFYFQLGSHNGCVLPRTSIRTPAAVQPHLSLWHSRANLPHLANSPRLRPFSNTIVVIDPSQANPDSSVVLGKMRLVQIWRDPCAAATTGSQPCASLRD